MSNLSSRSAKDREGFTPYHSGSIDFNEKELSLFSRLNLNDQSLDKPLLHEISFDKCSPDLLSVGSKKRKLSEQLMKSSKVGNKTFLNRSLLGKSSLNGELMNEMQQSYSNDHHKKQLSQNSCPVIIKNEQQSDMYFFQPQYAQQQRPRFTKTKNLLRNLSNYMHKFILYNKRAEGWVRQYFRQKLNKSRRKPSISPSLSNKSQIQNYQSSPCKEQKQKEIKENQPLSIEEEDKVQIKIEQEEDGQLSLQIANEIKEFFSWVSELSIGNFNDYEKIWTSPHKFRALYRIVCYKYYKSEAFSDIYHSRLTTKEVSISLLHQFIEGMLQPSQFYRFK